MEQKATIEVNPIKKYSKEDVLTTLLSGYTFIRRELWEHIPIGSRLKYFVTDQANLRHHERNDSTHSGSSTKNQATDAKEQRFRGGGTLSKHIITDSDHILVISGNKPGPIQYNQDNTYSYTISVKDIDEIWKAYPKDALLELHIIMNRLCEVEHQLAMLRKQIDAQFDSVDA